MAIFLFIGALGLGLALAFFPSPPPEKTNAPGHEPRGPFPSPVALD